MILIRESLSELKYNKQKTTATVMGLFLVIIAMLMILQQNVWGLILPIIGLAGVIFVLANKNKCKPSNTEKELRMLWVLEIAFIAMAFVPAYKVLGLTGLIVFVLAGVFYVIFQSTKSLPGLKVAAKISNVVFTSVAFLFFGTWCFLQGFKLMILMGLIFAFAGLLMVMINLITTLYSLRE